MARGTDEPVDAVDRAARDHAHDHNACLSEAVRRAEVAFGARGIKLTAMRRRVLEEIAGSHDAVGAYDVLDRLSRKTGERMAPVSVYRAIDALLGAGVVHRLESRNAYFACHAPHMGQPHIALVCEACGSVAEVDGRSVFAALQHTAATADFAVKRAVVEVVGRCRPCTGSAAR